MAQKQKSETCPELISDSQEAYSMIISNGAIFIVAKDIKGIAFGVKTLTNIITITGELPDLQIQDSPELEFRTVHFSRMMAQKKKPQRRKILN
jgi:N-acetyl-beta-hexosaminidase